MTSKWIQSAPAASTACTSSPKRAKSADRMDGEMMIAMVTLSTHAASGTDYLISLLYALRLFLGYLRHGLRQSVRHEFIRVMTAHLPPIRLGHSRVSRLRAPRSTRPAAFPRPACRQDPFFLAGAPAARPPYARTPAPTSRAARRLSSISSSPAATGRRRVRPAAAAP